MESPLGPRRVTFEVLRARLVVHVKHRINSGEFTERGLARILGISQTQAHNVLKGARPLQVALADRILVKLGLSATDLLSESELTVASRAKITKWEAVDMAEEIIPKKPVGSSGLAASAGERKAV